MAEIVSSSSTGRSLIKVPSGKVFSPYFARTKMPSSVVSSNSPAAKKAVSSFAFSVSVFSVSIFSFVLSRKLEGDSFEISFSISSFSAASSSVSSEAVPSMSSSCALLSDAKNAPSCNVSSVLSLAYAICTLLKLSTAHKNAESTLFPTPFPENFNIPSPYFFSILSAASALYHELFFYIFFNKSFNVHKSFYYFHKIGSLAFRQDPSIS